MVFSDQGNSDRLRIHVDHMSNIEADYRRVVESGTTRFLGGTRIEVIREVAAGTVPQHVLFDFDGTISLIREGWTEVMVSMMVEILSDTGTTESPTELRAVASQSIAELTGKQTIYQMIRLSEEVAQREGVPRKPVEYKQIYHDRLMQQIRNRREDLRSGRVDAEQMVVPGSLQLLRRLKAMDVQLYLASGTDESFVREEAELLGITTYFGCHIYGAIDDYRSFSKAQVIQRILSDNHITGEALLGFGDGYVEIQNIKEVGGTAVGVASDEAGRSGRPDVWKRQRLIGIGADLIVPDYQDDQVLVTYLWGDQS